MYRLWCRCGAPGPDPERAEGGHQDRAGEPYQDTHEQRGPRPGAVTLPLLMTVMHIYYNYVQVDGEPWIQPAGDIVVLRSALKVTAHNLQHGCFCTIFEKFVILMQSAEKCSLF